MLVTEGVEGQGVGARSLLPECGRRLSAPIPDGRYKALAMLPWIGRRRQRKEFSSLRSDKGGFSVSLCLCGENSLGVLVVRAVTTTSPC